MSETQQFLTLREVAARLRVSVETVRTLCARHEAGKPGGLASHHFGEDPDGAARKRMVSPEDLAAFVKSRRARDREIEKERVRQAFAAARRGTKVREWV